MKKNNWIILAIATAVSAFLLWLWYHLGFNKVDSPLDLVLSIIWWALIGVGGFSIHKIEQKRQERVRTCYVAGDHIFNSEAGTVMTARNADQLVEKLYTTLNGLEYGMDIADVPTDENGNAERFDYVVRSKVFKLKKEKDEDNRESEKLEWEGEVALPEYPKADPMPFSSREELTAIMGNLLGAAA